MLDIGFLEQVLVDLAFAGRIENLLLDLGVDRQFKADLLGQLLLAAIAARLFEFGEQILDRAMVLLEQRDGVQFRVFGHVEPFQHEAFDTARATARKFRRPTRQC